MTRKRKRFIGHWEWSIPEGYEYEHRSEQPGEGQVGGTGIVEAQGLWIGRVCKPDDGDYVKPFAFRVMRTDGEPGDRMLRFAGQWPAERARRELLARLDRLATEEVWNSMDELL